MKLGRETGASDSNAHKNYSAADERRFLNLFTHYSCRGRPRPATSTGGGGGGNGAGFFGRRSRCAKSSASRAFSYLGVPGLSLIDCNSAAGNSCASGTYF